MAKLQDADADRSYSQGQQRDTNPMQGKCRPLGHDNIIPPYPTGTGGPLPDYFRL